MDEATARALVSERGREALALASAQTDPDSLAAATALRARFDPALAAAALDQVALRRRGLARLGDAAERLFLTPAGSEQATRPAVAAWRAERLVRAGVARVVDLGCGIGADALAFEAAGLEVVGVERDPATAVFAQANLRGRVVCGDAEAVAGDLLRWGDAVFLDPARRTSSGRVWNVADFTPAWDFALGLLAERTGCVKLGPALPHRLIPDGVEATWVSHRGDVVEASLWSGPGAEARVKRAVLLPGPHELVPTGEPAEVGPVGQWLYEPDGAVIRVGGVADLARAVQGRLVAESIAYVTSDKPVATPFASRFEVLDELPVKEKALRAWVRDNEIGTLEIKKRGVDVDPALLRRRLRPAGPNTATLVLTPTPHGARTYVVRRA